MKIQLLHVNKDVVGRILKCYSLDAIILIHTSVKRQIHLLHYYDAEAREVKTDLVKAPLENIEQYATKVGYPSLWRSHRENLVNLKYAFALNVSTKEILLKGELRAKVSNNKMAAAREQLCRY